MTLEMIDPDILKARDRHEAKYRLRDKQSDRCYYCSGEFRPGVYKSTIDHVIPLSEGGADDESNWVAACHRCNQCKGSMSENEFKLLLLLGEFKQNSGTFIPDVIIPYMDGPYKRLIKLCQTNPQMAQRVASVIGR